MNRDGTAIRWREQLRATWQECWSDQVRLGEELLTRWSEPHRCYHSLQHLHEALASLAQVGGTSRVEWFAIWLHDAVWQGRRGDDERASAALAEARLAAAGVPVDDVSEVARLVLITIDHDPRPDDAAGQRISDADLSMLGARPERYAESARQIRADYAFVSAQDWRVGRRQVLTDFLGRPRLFRTLRGIQLWEAQARANIANELAGL